MNHLTSFIEKLKHFMKVLDDKNIFKFSRITGKVVWNLFLILLVITVAGGFFATGVGAGYFASLVKDEPIRTYDNMKNDIYNYSETSKIYFEDGTLLGNLRSDVIRQEVKIKDISPHLVDAVVATEDQYFHEHDGIVPKAIARAIFQEVTGAAVQTGGSTLTQQLVKNQILTREVSFDRKAKEMLLALRLERYFEKDEILEAYLNIVPFGRNASGRNVAGIQAAAQGIFGVDAKELSLPQAAFIAGLPQSPFGYTPFTNDGKVKENLNAGLTRMKTVLSRMHTGGYITKEQYEKALATDITKEFAKDSPSPFEQYPHLTMEIERRAINVMKKQLAEQDGKKYSELTSTERVSYKKAAELELRKKGYKIHTTINKPVYDAMQAAKNKVPYGRDIINPDTGEKEIEDVGAVLLDNKTGAIISFVGGRDYYQENLNHATQSIRPNGSTMKPLLVYAPAMEQGIIQPGSIIPDTKFSYSGTGSGKAWTPSNYSKSYHGLVTARKALQWSYNIPAARTYVKMDPLKATENLYKMGFTSLKENERYHRALALGGMEDGVSVEEATNAYATFGNSGEFVDGFMISKIESKDGSDLYSHKPKKTKVFSPQTAYLTIDMMRTVVKSGTAGGLSSMLDYPGEDWAGKTGTTQSVEDAWFIATNPKLTMGLRLGYDTPTQIDESHGGHGRRSQRVWAALMNAAYKADPDLRSGSTRHKRPGGIVTASFCGISGKLPSPLCKEAGLVKTDLFNVKYLPKTQDDSLQQVKYVVNSQGKKFKALASTPGSFTSDGVMIKEEYFKDIDLKDVIKDDWDNIIGEDELADNGKAPSAVGIKKSGSSLTWGASGENDVIGYRVYRTPNGSDSYSKVGEVKGGDATSFKISGGNFTYIVRAVDISGKESKNSNAVKVGEDPKPEPPPEKPEDPKKPKDPPPPGDGDKPKPPKPPVDPPPSGEDDGDGEGDSGDNNGNG
ncbi:transglycosylase domain-containing protein [Pseudalkalibacillus berkeleyi]|uniref:Penicillin-binding protein n=1 Tax=Pseudalkalibacillus berkeleyi TaxID=1069813 RepID=A0ABS9H343_9BACL|nr:transglycosylase domain-containing protein [Pseudalkalibacillus berkeleyi]MCF6138245.1 penicillin-binding protein [Pseudalkalibacillus berkeleyi]